MTSSIEAQWQSQDSSRRSIIKLMLWLILLLLLMLIGLWFWITQPLWSQSALAIAGSVDLVRLETHVRMLTTEFSPRNEAHSDNLERAAEYIREKFKDAGAAVTDQPYDAAGRRYRNVIARYGPETSSRIVVGAHYDTAGPLPGADDNASGTAGLIELAYLLGKQQLTMRVELVAFTLEEPPFFRTKYMGSAIHAQSLRETGVNVRAMISLEMIGYFSDLPNSQKLPAPLLGAFYPTEGNFIAVVGRMRDGLLVRRIKKAMRGATPLPVYSINAPTFVPGVDFSDQLNYWDAGYDAVMITDTAFFRNMNYHTAQDTAEKLDYKRMAMVVEGILAGVLALAD